MIGTILVTRLSDAASMSATSRKFESFHQYLPEVMTGSRNCRTLFGTLLLTLFFAAAPAGAQEYKEAYNSGLEAAKASNLTEALQKFSLAANGAKAAGDVDVERRSQKLVAQIEYNLGRRAANADDQESAMTHFDNGIASYPAYAKNYLGRAVALKKLDRIDDAMAGFQKTVEVATAERDTKTARAAEGAIRDHYVFLASSLLASNGGRPTSAQADEAIGHLTKLQEMVSADADVHYYRAIALKAKGDNSGAIAAADQALELHRGSRTDKAKIYFVKGEAMMSNGDAAGARDAFRNAAVGSYKASAEHFLETLGTN